MDSTVAFLRFHKSQMRSKTAGVTIEFVKYLSFRDAEFWGFSGLLNPAMARSRQKDIILQVAVLRRDMSWDAMIRSASGSGRVMNQ